MRNRVDFVFFSRFFFGAAMPIIQHWIIYFIGHLSIRSTLQTTVSLSLGIAQERIPHKHARTIENYISVNLELMVLCDVNRWCSRMKHKSMKK